MLNIAKHVSKIKNTSGRNDKMSLVKQGAEIEGFKEAMAFIFNPYMHTGIAATKLRKGEHNAKPYSAEEVTVDTIVDYYKTHTTGSDADVHQAWCFINAFDDQLTRDLVEAIITKKLTIGVTVKTFNKVYGDDFIPVTGVMLSEKYSEQKDKVKGPFVVTEKLDGIRRILVKHNGTIAMYSRSGQPDEGLVDIIKEAKYLPDECVYDGELLAQGEYSDCIALRQATNSIANRKGNRTGVIFNVFDMIPADEFMFDKCSVPCDVRKTLLAALFKDEQSLSNLNIAESGVKRIIDYNGIDYDFKYIKPVPVLGVVETEEEIMDLCEPIWERKGEGVMLNTAKGLYEIKRSKSILKVKSTESHDLKIVDFIEGTGKYAGKLGALVVDYNGNRVGVGSGLSDVLRETIWNNKEDYLGLIVEIDCQGESTNQNGGVSLNCPIFKGIRYDK